MNRNHATVVHWLKVYKAEYEYNKHFRLLDKEFNENMKTKAQIISRIICVGREWYNSDYHLPENKEYPLLINYEGYLFCAYRKDDDIWRIDGPTASTRVLSINASFKWQYIL